MTYNEFQFNKQLLREINQKLKTNSSVASEPQGMSALNDEEGEWDLFALPITSDMYCPQAIQTASEGK